MDAGQVRDVDLDLFDGEVGEIARLNSHRLSGGANGIGDSGKAGCGESC
jgi:hypothetical protein